MVFSLPGIGESNWGQKLLDSINAVKGTADAAQPAPSLESAVSAKLGTGGSLDAGLTASYVPKWKTGEAVTAGTIRLSPNGDIVSSKADHTTGATFNPANWNQLTAHARVIDMLSSGAVADGTTDDTAIWTAAKTAAGSKGTVHFPAKPGSSTTTYYFAGTSAVDLAGTNITADPSVTLSIYSTDFINVRAWQLRSALTIYQRKEQMTLVHPANAAGSPVGVAPSLSLGNTLREDDSTWAKLDFTTGWSKRNYSVAAGVAVNTYAAGTSTTTARGVTFTGTETSGTYEGVYYTSLAVGEEVTVRVKVGASVAAGYVAAQVNSDTETVFWTLPDSQSGGANAKKVLRQRKTSTAAPTTQKTVSVPDPAYGPQSASTPLIGIRRCTTTDYELYINGVRWDRITLAGTFDSIGFALVAPAYTSTTGATITDPIKRSKPPTVGGHILNIAVVGESTAYGSSQANTWAQDYLPALLRGQPGILDVNITNLAHSGDKAADTLAIVNANSMTAYDYVLVLVGANDINSQTAQATYETNLTSIGNKIVSDGSVPVFGIVPMFAYAGVGNVGPARVNYALGSYIRQSIAWVATTNSWALADIQSEMGAIGSAAMPQLFDGLHQTAFGGVLTARGFARKVVNLVKGVQA